jgi:hypothetical protein
MASSCAFRRRASVAVLAAWLAFPAAAFDTYWHSQCVQKAGEQFGFTPDAWKIMQLGNFSADLFGPISEYSFTSLAAAESEALAQYQTNNPQVRGAAVFLHFDNLNSDFQSNSNFDYLFSRLLASTQNLLAGYGQLKVDDRVRRVLTLVTLGASLHAVQDFYSHSDWIHNSFDATDVKTASLADGGIRAPTWFEFRARRTNPDQWPFRVQSGIYPPVAGATNTHTHMNHDNSRLMYTETENPGQPLRSQAEYHNAGPAPARGDEAASLARQQLAVNTAIAASIEWVNKVRENAGARKSIDAAKTWNLKTRDPRLAKELEAGLLTAMVLSCTAGKWDGDNPPGNIGLLCRSVLERRMNSVSGGSKLESELIGLAAGFLVPAALKFTGMLWDVHGQYHILEGLAQDIGSNSGHYSFSKK